MPLRLRHLQRRRLERLRVVLEQQAIQAGHRVCRELRCRLVRGCRQGLSELRRWMLVMQRSIGHRLYCMSIVRTVPPWWRVPRRVPFHALCEQRFLLRRMRLHMCHLLWLRLDGLPHLPGEGATPGRWCVHLQERVPRHRRRLHADQRVRRGHAQLLRRRLLHRQFRLFQLHLPARLHWRRRDLH